RPGVAVAAVQHANGEIGTIQDVEAGGEAARAAGGPLVVDAGASVEHVPVPQAGQDRAVDPGDWGSAPGCSVLVLRTGLRWAPVGPEDEVPVRPGLPDVPAALAAAVSLEAVLADQGRAAAHRRRLVDRLRAEVPARVSDVDVAGDP